MGAVAGLGFRSAGPAGTGRAVRRVVVAVAGQRLQREYVARGDMSADRSELHEAMWEAYPLTDRELAQLERMNRGDYSGMWTQDEHGNWGRLP